MPLSRSGSALFAGSCGEFLEMAPRSELTAHLVREFSRRWGQVSASEEGAWRRSLTALAQVVRGTGLESAGVGVELRLPLTDRRIDASFVGRDAASRPTVVLVELKQWDRVEPSNFPDNVVVGGCEALHPSVQVGSYADYLRDSHSAFTEHGFALWPCAYLHDMRSEVAEHLREGPYETAIARAPLFVRGDENRLAALLRDRVGVGNGIELLPSVVEGRYSPSKHLIESVAKALGGSRVWTLLDEQRVAFNVVRGLVQRAAATEGKGAVLVVGGPGTGKSVVAVHLLVTLGLEGGYRVCHATGSKAFTTNLRAIGPASSAALFRYFNSFRHKVTPPDAVDVLICDEAHRIRRTSNDRRTPRSVRSEISQARELIRAARVTVFFMDEQQNVRPGEIGTSEEVAEAAREEGVPLHRIDLNAQFRCNGCTAYIEWVDRLLSDSPSRAGGWLESGEYTFAVFDTPRALEEAILRRVADGATGRLVAGFCWPWSDPREDGSLVEDVRIGDWRRPWNEKSLEQTRARGATPPPQRHPYYLWATQPERIREIGCIYSAQGFEWDYCGVVMGNDLVWREGRGWVAWREASCDQAVRKGSVEDEELRAYLRHTYRVLLTRGMRGTFVHSTDPETRRLLRWLTATDSMARGVRGR